MAFGEYLDANNTHFAGNKANPVNRKVWVDTIYNYGEGDKIHGKTRAPYYTYDSLWLTNLTDYFNTTGMWDGVMTAKDVCTSFASTLQELLDDMNANR